MHNNRRRTANEIKLCNAICDAITAACDFTIKVCICTLLLLPDRNRDHNTPATHALPHPKVILPPKGNFISPDSHPDAVILLQNR